MDCFCYHRFDVDFGTFSPGMKIYGDAGFVSLVLRMSDDGLVAALWEFTNPKSSL